MANIKQNIANLYDTLIADGYFRDDNDEINCSVEQFGENLSNAKLAKVFYANLLEDGYFREGEDILLSEEDFLKMVGAKKEKREFYPLASNQMGLYFDWEMNPDTTQYNIPTLKKYAKDKIDAARLCDAVSVALNSHPYLATTFGVKDDEVVQYPHEDRKIEVAHIVLDNEPGTAYFQKKVLPFNLKEDCLCRAEVIETPQYIYLFTDIHHIVSDGVSFLILDEAISKAYVGEEPEAEVLSSYDYAVSEEEARSGDAYQEAEQYYDSMLGGAESVAYPHSADLDDSTLRNVELRKTIDGSVIGSFCEKNNVTENAYYMAAFMQVLHRITREDSIFISTINNGRSRAELMNTMGMFIKTLPVISTLPEKNAGNISAVEYASQFQTQYLNAIQRDFYPFSEIVKRHGLHPDIMYVFQDVAGAGVLNEGDNVPTEDYEQVTLTLDTAKVPLKLSVFTHAEGKKTFEINYDATLYNEADMQLLLDMVVAAALSLSKAKTLADISILPEEQRETVESFRQTAQADVPLKLHHQPIEKNAVEMPDAVALIAKDCTLTFKQFNEEANRIAHALMERGVKRGDRVVLLLPRTSAVIVSMFGVSKTGAAYIPCDPAYPTDRINLIMTDSEAQYVVTNKDYIANYDADKVIDIDDIYRNEAYSTENPDVEISPEDLAYLIYTSGSTGKPKGVMLRHVGITNYLYNHPANVHVSGLMRLGVKTYVSITTLSFDMSLKEFAGSLYNGITTVLADEQETIDPILLAKLMKKTGAEAINGTCSRIQSYLELPEFCDAIRICKMVWSGGEMYPQSLLEKLKSLGVEIINTYGPTEITVSSNIANLTHSKRVTVGRPLLNYVEYIVDRFDREVPVGVAGELLIGGPGVARGYNNLPEMTAERFVEYNGVRVYRSGDLARWTPDGEVEILGRIDNQVKINGFRVELGEIETQAEAIEGVQKAIAVVKKISGMDHLILYYTLAAGSSLTDAAIDAALKGTSLAEYMIPDIYMQIDVVPLTPNGKTNVKALPEPQMKAEEIVKPRNEQEQKMWDLISEMLGTTEFGVETNLVTVGLSSIAAIRLSAIFSRNDIQLSTRDIMQNPVISKLVAKANVAESMDEQPLKPHELREWYPMCETQKGMYFDCITHPDAIMYNIPSVATFVDVDRERLIKAVKAVLAAHPYLNCRLAEHDGEVMQHRDDSLEPIIKEVTLDKRPDNAFFQSQIRPFDVMKEPLYRFTLYHYKNETSLLTDIHHLISDGSSNQVLAFELKKAFDGQPLEKEQYTAYDRAIDETELFHSERGKEAEAYFDNIFDGVESTDYPHSATLDGGKVYDTITLDIDSDEINSYCKKNLLMPSSFFMSVFHAVLHRLTREDKTLIHFISNGRSELKLANFFGVFVKTLPSVCADFKRPMAEIVKAIDEQMRSTIDRDFYPFSEMVSRHDINVNILYNYFVDLETDVVLDNQAGSNGDLNWDTAKNPLSITMLSNEKGDYQCFLEYDATIYNRRDMEILGKAFKCFAENCVKDCYTDITCVPMLTAFESDAIICQSQGKQMPVDQNDTFVSKFLRQATATPDAVAVSEGTSHYTYGELDDLSNALAHKLIETVGLNKGQSPFMSIMLGYEKAFLVAAIAIERAGYAYVPLDYDYPNDRLLYMLEDSESQVLVTSHAIFDEKTKEGDDFTAKNIIFIDDFLASASQSQMAEAINHATPDGLAYMIYTSGSTGKPKGVMIPHRAKANFVSFIAKEWGHTSKSHICCHSSFSFDASIEDLYPVLTVGGALYIVPQLARKDMDMLHKFIVDNGITGGCYTTQLGQMLLQQYPDLPVDYLVVGGEKMTAAPKCNCRLINTYGPTEFTVDATFFEVDKTKEYKNIPIGRPLHNLTAYVLDKYGNLMPQGVPGELCMAGPQMAAGYWKREDLTEEKFVKCAFASGKVYHTGDLVRYNEDGDIEYMGRIDNQVKLRGFRIELGEIETLISKYEGVAMVCVQVKEIGGVQHLVAYYSANTEIDKSALEAYLSESLTEYMVPDVYMQLDEMPLTPNGKVNTKLLPMPEIEQTEYVEPVGEKEIAVAECISQVLSIDGQIGALDNFFSLGGDSIKSIRLVSMLRQKGVTVTVADVMKAKTVRAIAALAQSGIEDTISQETVTGEILPGAIQRYFFGLNLPHAEHFNQSVAIESKTPINIEALRQSLDAVTIHHDMLRLRAEDGKIYINETDKALYDFSEIAVTNKDEITPHASKLHASIDFKNGPVMKVGVYHLPASDVLVLICHHMAVDGVSWRIITEDLVTAYNQRVAGKDISLPKKTHSFKYYTEAIQRYRDSYKLSLEKAYWEGVQKKMLLLPQGGGSADYISNFSVQYDNACLTHLLTDAHNAYNTTENDLLISALLRSYREVTGNDSVSLMMEGHGREPIHEPIVSDRTVGWFTSMYTVVIEGINGDMRHDIRLVKETFRSVPNKGLGYGILQYIPSQEGDNNLRTDLTECLGFNYLGDVKGGDAMGGFEIADDVDTGIAVNKEGETGVTYMINCTIVNGVFVINVSYDTKVYTEEQAHAIVDGFCTQLEAIVAHTLSVTATEPTASDLGASGWTDSQFEAIKAEYAERGEDIQRVYPLTPMQEGILLEYMNDPKTSAYVLINRYEMGFVPTEQQVRYALDVLAAKHEVFRTSVIYRGVDTPCQAIVNRQLGLRFVDISDETDIYAASERVHKEELAATFDLQSSPLYRVVVLKTSENSCHILLVTHHIIIDGWCQPIYFHDFLAALQDAMAGNFKPITAGDQGRYEEAVRDMLTFDKKTSFGYWRELLADYTDKAVIPYSDKPEAEAKRVAQSLSLNVEPSVMQQLQELCSKYEVTLNTIMEYVWGTTLHVFNNNTDAVFGKVVSGRNHGDVSDLVGLFINTIPVRVKTDETMTVLDALRSLQQQAADSATHDYCSLAEIQQQSSLRGNLLQSTLIFENYAGKENMNAMGSTQNIKSLQTDEEIFNELRLVVLLDDEGTMCINMMYDGNLYSEHRMQSVIATMQHLLTSLPVAINTKVTECAIMSEEDKAAVVKLSQGKDMPFDYSKTYLDHFIAKAAEVPDNLAVDDDSRQLTYAELDHRSNLVAHKLISMGVAKQNFIGLMIERSVDFPTCVFGIHKAAAAYLPLDLEYPNERLSYMLENSEAPIVISTHDVFEAKRNMGGFEMLQTMLDNGKVLFVDDIDWTEDCAPINLCTPDCYTYIIYTSGSTGKPKGVVLHHLGLMSYILSTTEENKLTADDRISSHRSFSFDSHIEDLYAILLLGGSLHIMPSAIRKDLQAVYDFVVRHKITGGGYTTSIAALLVNNFDMPVRYVSAIGEKLTGVVSRDAQILNYYGPTECTDHISMFPMEKDKEYTDIPIGHVVANSWCFIVDNYGRLVPDGAIGELCIAGIQVGVGYWHLPEQTAKVYGDCPFVEKNINGTKVRMYHTGDLARYNDKHQLECLGRMDGQVKVRGYRIELGEIESVAKTTDGLGEVVAAVKVVNGTAMIVLYYTVADASVAEADIVKVIEGSALADYMYPSVYMKLDDMPRLPNGKINRKALPEPVVAAEEYIAPQTEIEQKLADGIQEMLRIEKISVTSNLLSLGLTSLLAMRLAMAITQGMNVKISVGDIMKMPTIRQIAAHVEKNKQDAPKGNALFNKRNDDGGSPEKPKAGNPLAPKANPLAPKTGNPLTPKANPLAPKANPLAPKTNPLMKNPLKK